MIEGHNLVKGLAILFAQGIVPGCIAETDNQPHPAGLGNAQQHLDLPLVEPADHAGSKPLIGRRKDQVRDRQADIDSGKGLILQ